MDKWKKRKITRDFVHTRNSNKSRANEVWNNGQQKKNEENQVINSKNRNET